jgi:dihydropyrimidine dehydrogenase (NAD+) subunit PreA
MDLSVDFCGFNLINPFMLSSSPVSNSAEMCARAFEAGWGGVAYKTIVSDRIPIIHPSPRMNVYTSGDKRMVGIQNVEQTSDRGLKANLLDIMYLKKHWPDRLVMASIMGFSNQEWADLSKACADAGADMLEVNVSCPHMTVEGSGAKVGQCQELVQKFTETCRNSCSIPIVAKMTSGITDITVPAMYAKQGGADGIAAINSVAGLTGIGLDNWVPEPNVFGKGSVSGFTGPAIKPIGLRCVSELAKHPELKLPLSGIGGIETWVDALEYLLVGATTIQVTTGIIHYGQGIVESMIEGLSDYMAMKGVSRVQDLVGKALPNLHATHDFDLARQGVAKYDLDRCIGCGQCYTVCKDAGGWALDWDAKKRRPVLDEKKCLSCMVCSFACPVDGLITFKEMPKTYRRADTVTLGKELESQLKM